jgi:tetratricopeptide (TPR) repeat protein
MEIHLGRRVAALRQELGLDQSEFAELLGMTQSRVSQIEDSPWLQKRTLDNILAKTGRDLPTLLGLVPAEQADSAARGMAAERARFEEACQRFAGFLNGWLDRTVPRLPPREALLLCEEILTLTHSFADPWAQTLRAQTLLRLADLRETLGEYTSAQASLEACLKLCERLGDTPRQQACLYKLGTLHYRSGDYEEALSYFRQAAAAEDWQMRYRGLVGQSVVHEQRGEFEAALNCLEEAEAVLPKEGGAGPSLAQIYIASARVNVALARGDYGAAEALACQAWEAARQAGDRGAELEQRINLALCRHHLGRDEEALELLREARSQPEAAEQKRRWSLIHAVEAQVQSSRGEPEAAVAAGEEALRVAEALGEKVCLFYAHLGLGEAYRGQAAHRSFHHYQQALHIATAADLRIYQALAWERLAHLHLELGEWADAEAAAERAVAGAASLGAQAIQAWALLHRARAQAALGRLEAAQESARRAAWVLQGRTLPRIEAALRQFFPGVLDPPPRTAGDGNGKD